ncbi:MULTISPECIES: formyltetrahydrofolate deformylase [unclassified Lebetimonas]|jgi:formyltetrahydrofolate deformylase|uniref:formyltetrahydrofolate deformylase n=1 Tax=unclassified Lebetimonas TaxID=2648158 RepID=UPI00046743A5|nr:MULTISPECIES: formyltetrahydrofolate deformylase [unclassified Lebetimonas]
MQYTLLIDCNDEKGLIYKISKILYKNDFNIESQQEFVDKENNKFFFRAVITGKIDKENLKEEILKEVSCANVRIYKKRKKRVFLLATKEAHALGDILIKQYSGDLDIEIIGVIANRNNLKDLVEKFNIPFYYVPAENLNRTEHENKMLEIIMPTNPDYIILAKFMRILTPNFVEKFPNKIINIHHSFLPAFIGANPYKQAYDRGVKIIGATAHFVNNNLDDGPIIEQDVIRVDHEMSWEEMRIQGRDIEKIVLSRAIKKAIEDRIFVYANKTIIL